MIARRVSGAGATRLPTSSLAAVEWIAHRGNARVHPENSIPAVLAAIEDDGADAIELDVHLTRDDVPVVHHDPVVGAANESAAVIAALDAERVTRCELAPGVHVPTLVEVAAAVAGRARLYVEIKDGRAERAVHAALADTRTDYAIHSFDHRVALRSRAAAPQIATGLLSTSYPVSVRRLLSEAGATDWWAHWSVIDAQLAADVHVEGGRVIAWTVDDAPTARALAAMGVDAICTDDVRAMREAVREVGREAVRGSTVGPLAP